MSPRLADIRRHRALLLAQTAAQRRVLGDLVRQWQRPLALIEAGVAAARVVRHHPVMVALAVALLVRVSGRRLGAWLGRLGTAWGLYQSLRQHWPRRVRP